MTMLSATVTIIKVTYLHVFTDTVDPGKCNSCSSNAFDTGVESTKPDTSYPLGLVSRTRNIFRADLY